ncbi:polysaccharide biosynthesis/export family protein [Desulfovibrio litoralis]|uniref:Protein involved in polysaccharide export, contains SLBB domain of the beta-grasp fold n=1 Tax=Desulfovibrio litoralis DSM 11393 TaxID=1121455 RepID=A0A1M7TMY9_9BACT|nr:polysaccharide biosynthesis/export family protein [Desulfovibrio litoralis]SHN72050.1 protein involved in polysaccharide export, contains SLBB domain of the beta-grasp fold [Desulfovibrio litoralis DSM 11393]
MQRFFIVFALILVPFIFSTQAKAQTTLDNGLSGNGFTQTTSPSAMRGTVPSNMPMSGSLPSGQGAGQKPQALTINPNEGNMNQSPLFVPGYSPFSTIYNNNSKPAWAQGAYTTYFKSIPPFGANLFQGFFAGTYHAGINEKYIITPGDRILVHIWGATAFDEVLMVDQQGNIFLPEVGPVRVGGLPNSSLQNAVKDSLSAAYRSNVQAYATLLSAQPVAVYVTGFVKNPGRYAGGTTDSALYYIDRAGGILPERGSYRDIKIQRNGRTIASIDLYNFILKGNVFNSDLQDGDVIVVGPKGKSILATGLIPQHAVFESLNKRFTGSDLNALTNPESATSHVSIRGTRNTEPFHVYLTLKEFDKFELNPNDSVEYLADKAGKTIMVSVSGATLNQSHFPVTNTTTLRTLLSYVAVNPDLAQTSAVYIKRRSIAEQQKKTIKDSLWRLEHSVLTATSSSANEAEIRIREAELVQNFVQRAATVEPDGVVVVTHNGLISDMILEDGDEIVIPQFSDVVQVSGEVMMPKAVAYSSKYTLKDYVNNSGGYTDRADENDILIVHANGAISSSSNTKIGPGDLLMVMPKYDSKDMQIVKDITQILYQIAVATRVVVSM